ncbi:MAG: flagellar basal body rod protein FlgC [Defluviitaleaceae bacterium]|nr:flagellar basal body rod protein FlgC [Defluviitaleaceae bacterium]
MSFFNSMHVAATGLTAQRLRMDIISENIANANTTRTGEGGPFRRRTVIMQSAQPTQFSSELAEAFGRSTPLSGGVRISQIATDPTQGPMVYDPAHPDANSDGYVQMPNVNIVMEMVNMISASRSYEANITAMNVTRGMIARTMEIGRG